MFNLMMYKIDYYECDSYIIYLIETKPFRTSNVSGNIFHVLHASQCISLILQIESSQVYSNIESKSNGSVCRKFNKKKKITLKCMYYDIVDMVQKKIASSGNMMLTNTNSETQ